MATSLSYRCHGGIAGSFACDMGILISPYSFAAGQAGGTLKEIFVNEVGAIALRLNEGFDSALVSSKCPTTNGFTGHSNPDPALKSALLAAFAANQKVRLCINGCNGSWLKVTCVYVTH
jgi:hypothetical protein